MNRNPRHSLWLLCALVALAFGLAGCGGDEPAPVAAPPAPPPAPPPFQPQPVEVALGENGGTATLMTTEAGGFTLNGEAFTGGTESPVEGEGGRMYVLTLADGTWTAAFQPMEIMVALGASEESATLMTTEAGGYTLGGEEFASGGTAMTEAGGSYTLTLGEDGMWAAAFMPMEITVALGASGDSATLWTTEAGGYTLGGEEFASGGTAMTEAGGSYTLTLGEDGMWAAAFMPMEITVALGASEESATLMTTEAGGYTLGGEEFASGDSAMSSGGGSYTLTLGEDGMWVAAFVPMPVPVELGDGTSLSLMTTEAGGFTRDGADFASGTTVDGGPNLATGANNRYTLTLGEDGMWTAAFVPATQTVRLGGLGGTVTLSSTEAGTWTVDGSAFASGDTREAPNGNVYTLTLGEDGTWTGAFVPVAVPVSLGGSEETVTLWTTEDMGVTLDGQAVVDGSTTMSTARETYVFARDENGTWSATHRPATQRVALLGTSVTLVTNEAGGWTLGDRTLSSGDTVEGADNAATGAKNEYVLTLADGTWTSEYQPATMTIGGTDGLVASPRENGTGYDVGDASLPASGRGEITVDDAMYRVAKDADGMLAGTRFDADIEGEVMKIDTTTTITAAPSLIADNRATDLDEKNTAVKFHTAEFSVGDLLGSGVATVDGPNIVAKARAEMVKIRARVAGLVALRREGGLTSNELTTQLGNQWNAADKQIEAVFAGDRALERTTSETRVLDAFDRVIEALSSEAAFAAATLDGGPDQLQGFATRSAAAAAAAFNRRESKATARLGALGSTRFGAAVFNQTTRVQDGFGTAERAQAFAWSTMLATRRSADVRVSGAANYAGRTHAADQAGNLYAGAIAVNVRFTREAVDGRVDGLQRADTGEPFAHGLGGAVTGIVLPTAKLGPRATWNVTTDDSNRPGRLQYASLAGGQPDLDLSNGSTFMGRLLGRGDQAGAEAIGTWTAKAGSTTLAGAFGATRGADTAPPGTALTGDLASIGKTGNTWARLERKPAVLAAIVSDPDATPPVTVAAADVRPEIKSPNVLNTGNAKFNFVPQPPDTPAGHPNGQGDEYVVGNYTPDRETVVDEQDWEGAKGNWVSSARAEIVKKLAQLRRSIALDGADASASDTMFANDQRQRLFTEIQTELKKVFGPGRAASTGVAEIYTGVLTRDTTRDPSSGWTAHVDYPVNAAGVAQDAAVLAEIEDVIEALESADAFADALADGGLFAATRTGSADLFPAADGGYPSASAIFGRARGKLLIAADDTDYTRLGAWRHQISEHAADALSTQSYVRGDRGPELGAFAYSPLDPTAAYSDASSRQYPAGGADGTVKATYAGKTVAAQGDLFYRGDVEASVFWSPTAVTDSEITVEISDLEETASGELLQVGNRVLDADGAPRPGLKTVESLTWRLEITNTGEVRFGGDTSRSVTVAVNTLNEDPFMPAYNDQLRFTRRWIGSGPNEYYFGTENDHYRLVADGEGAGTDSEDDYGELSLSMVGTGGGNNDERAPTAAEMTDFTEGVAELRYPKYIVGGPQIQYQSESVGDSHVMVFADGSMLMFGQPGGGGTSTTERPYRRAFGIETDTPAIVAANIAASLVAGDPAITDNNNEYFFSGPSGYVARAYPAIGPSANNAGVGAPTMSTAELFEAFVRAGDYVNVRGTDAELASTVEGMFVGQDQDGPLGIIGTWELTGGIFGTGDERGVIRGAFGADLQP